MGRYWYGTFEKEGLYICRDMDEERHDYDTLKRSTEYEGYALLADVTVLDDGSYTDSFSASESYEDPSSLLNRHPWKTVDDRFVYISCRNANIFLRSLIHYSTYSSHLFNPIDHQCHYQTQSN